MTHTLDHLFGQWVNLPPSALDKGKGKEKEGEVVIGPDGNPIPQAPVQHRIPHGLKAFVADVAGELIG